MGALLGVAVTLVSLALFYFFGVNTWVLGISLALALAGLVVTILFGHRGFGGGGNTDMLMYLAVVGVALVIALPQLREHLKQH